MLEIKNLVVKVEDELVLNKISIAFENNKTYAILGPNGNGKSTLFNVIMGHPDYTIESGDILYNGQSILKLTTDERANLGLFLGVQHPIEVPGVLAIDFLQAISRNNNMAIGAFYRKLEAEIDNLKINFDVKKRFLNEGFSGGEKKKHELLQMNILDPQIALLDEIDSGLDRDALIILINEIKKRQEKNKGSIIISHYDNIFSQIVVDKAFVIVQGKVVKEGDNDLVGFISKWGYEWIEEELGIKINKDKESYDEEMLTNCGGCSGNHESGCSC